MIVVRMCATFIVIGVEHVTTKKSSLRQVGQATLVCPTWCKIKVTTMNSKKSALLRMDNVAIIVEDLEAAIAFFTELGLELEGKTTVEGPWVDRIVGLDDVRSDIVMMRTPDGHSRLELTKFQKPKAIKTESNTPVNTLGIRRMMFAVTDIDDVVARLQQHGAELIGEVVQYEDMYRLCYLRGPEGIMVALAEQLGKKSATDVLENS